MCRFAVAASRLAEALRFARRSGDEEWIAQVLVERGRMYRDTHDYARALADLNEVMQWAVWASCEWVSE
jgi:hypothetical protein